MNKKDIQCIGGVKGRPGFTLAEVLVTLAVIGVVASLTIPALIKSYEKQVYVSQLKKSYSELSRATMSIVSDQSGNISHMFPDSSPYPDTFMQEFLKYVKTLKVCEKEALGCFPATGYKTLKGADYWINIENQDLEYKFILSSGAMVAVRQKDSECSNVSTLAIPDSPAARVCARFLVDVNGFKGPNQHGRDLHTFTLTNSGLILENAYTTRSIDYNCSLIYDEAENGSGCARRIMAEGGMNY